MMKVDRSSGLPQGRTSEGEVGSGMNSVEIDFDACTGCKTCYLACFADVIRWDAEAKRPVVAYPEDCVHCNLCEISCKDEAIKVVADWDMSYPPVMERGFPYTVGGRR